MKQNKKDKHLVLRLDEKLFQLLEDGVATTEMSRSAFIRTALKQFLIAYKPISARLEGSSL